MTLFRMGIAALACAALTAGAAEAQTRVTYKSAKTGTSYYQMGVELSEAVREGTDGAVSLTVEESQGSVQNVMEAAVRPGSYVFTSPPGLVGQASEGAGPFESRPSERFAEIRGLFPIPSLTMHIVVANEGGEGTIALDDLEGRTILLGRGSFGATEGEKYLEMFDLADRVTVADAELGNASDALTNGQIDGFVTAGSFPAPNVIEAAAGSSLALVSMSDEQIERTGRTKLVIPAGTYSGIDADAATTSLPVIAYTTTQMDEDTAYRITKAFWEKKAEMADSAPWWEAVSTDQLDTVARPLHPGALRYYEEAGVEVPEALR